MTDSDTTDTGAQAPGFFQSLAGMPWHAALALVLFCLAVYLPGLLRLPAVDRTEIVYAETTRGMVERGSWLDPRYGETVHQFRPIGTFWAQGIAATVAGPSFDRTIAVYRVPGAIAVTLAVVALYFLSAPLIGGSTALIAAALFAVAPLTVLVSQLAIAEGLSLLPATVAMLALLRLYASNAERPAPQWMAYLFWFALGAGMLLNALLVPILVVTALIALLVMDRDAAWLMRLKPALGVPLALLIASPWIIVRAHQDGVPFAGMDWRSFAEALGGAQDMKLRAMPGTFIAAALLGFLPGTALLAPAVLKLWPARGNERIARFLLAWIIGYIVYLEVLSSKPGTYMVQVLYPAFALAVAMLVRDWRGEKPPQWNAIPWPPLAALFGLALLALPYVFTLSMPGIAAIVLIAGVAALFATSAAAGREGQLERWARHGIAGLALFAVTLLAVILPSLDKLWPMRDINRVMAAACPAPLTPGLLGYREPSGIFVLRAPRGEQSTDALFAANPAVAVVESRWLERYFVANAARGAGQSTGTVIGCTAGLNVMRGCPVSFTIFQRDASAGCTPAPDFACNTIEKADPRSPGGGCD